MKKLSVVLLAILFIFGLAVQAGAVLEKDLGETAFEGDYKITFGDDDVSINDCQEIINQYDKHGVIFDVYGGLLGENNFINTIYWGREHVAGNFDGCNYTLTQQVITVKFDPPVTRVGFYGLSYGGGILVKVFRGEVDVGQDQGLDTFFVTPPKPVLTFIGIGDTDGIDRIEISGTGSVSGLPGVFFIDDFQFGGTPDTTREVIPVNVNIKPPNCLDARIPINLKSHGVTPAVIAGSADLDVTMIDPDSIELNGVPPVRSAIEDVSTCGSEDEGDGDLDLVLKFDTQKLVEAMEVSEDDREAIQNGEWPSKKLELTGNLFEESGGTAIEGETSVTLVGKLKPAKANNGKVSFEGHDRGHHHGWDNSHGQHKHKGWDNH